MYLCVVYLGPLVIPSLSEKIMEDHRQNHQSGVWHNKSNRHLFACHHPINTLFYWHAQFSETPKKTWLVIHIPFNIPMDLITPLCTHYKSLSLHDFHSPHSWLGPDGPEEKQCLGVSIHNVLLIGT